MRSRSTRRRAGAYVLAPVLVLLAVVAAVSFLIGFEGSVETASTARALEAEQARLVAEAGLSQARWVLSQNSTCAGYADLPATAFGPHQFEVSVSPASGSPVALVASGTLASGARSSLVRRDKSYRAAIPLELPTDVDTFLWDGAHSDKNFGANVRLSLDNVGQERVTLLKFAFPALPSGRVVSAELELYLEGGDALSNGKVDVHRVSRSWEEGRDDDVKPTFVAGATYEEYAANLLLYRPWTNPGGDYDPTPVSSLTMTGLTPGFRRWDVTSLVESWLAGGTNDGLLLRASTGVVDEVDFTSSDTGISSRHPKLVLQYVCECGVDCVVAGTSQRLLLSTADNAQLGGVSFEARDLVEYEPGDTAALLFFDGSTVSLSAGIDALHVLENGHLLLSTTTNAMLGGIAFQNGDLVEYDLAADKASVVFEEDAVFADDANIISVAVTGTGRFVFSTDEDVEIGGEEFRKIDLIEFDRVTGEAWLFLEGETTTLDRPIDALHLESSGQLVLSAAATTTLGGLTFGAGDLVRYDPASDTATRIFDVSSFAGGNENIRSLHVGPGSGTTEMPGPLAHWKLDDAAGDEALDSIGGHDGELLNGPAWTAGVLDGAIELDGDDDVIDLTAAPELEDLFEEGATLTAWIRPLDWGENGAGRILDKTLSESSVGAGWALGVHGPKRALFFTQQFSLTYGYWSTPVDSISLDAWHHVAVVYSSNSAAENPAVYIDGARQTLLEERLPLGTARSDAGLELRLGNHSQNTSRAFEGAIDDVRLYGRRLWNFEIVALAQAGGGGGPGGGGSLAGGCSAGDDFETSDFTGSTGDLDWSGPWNEVSESDGADSGDVRIRDQGGSEALQIQDSDGGGEGVERGIDLSGRSGATLRFKTWRSGLDNSSDYVALSVSSNGGSSWTELARFAGPSNDSGWVDQSYDLGAYLSNQTVIRFRSSSSLGGSDRVYFDDVVVDVVGGGCS